MNLRQTQHCFKALILNPTTMEVPAGFMKESPRGLSDEKRLEIYGDDYRLRAIECLGEVFPNIRRILDCEEFDLLVRRYYRAYPSKSHDLGNWGADLEVFLRADRLSEERPFLADLAHAEWILTRAFHESRQTPVRLETLIEQGEDFWLNAAFTFQPSMHLLSSEFPLARLLHVKDLSDEQLEAFELDAGGVSQFYLVLSQGVDRTVQWRTLEKEEFEVLSALREGRSITWICEHVLTPEQAAHLQTWFAAWLEDGLVTAIG